MTESFAHDMPFGARLRPEGGATFRLWAPALERIELVAGDRAPLEVAVGADGFAEATVDDAVAGERYAWRLPDGLLVPDPASRHQPEGVHRASRLVDPLAYAWRRGEWRGRPWEEAVVYELHAGAFAPPGGFDGVRRRLDYLERLGVTAIELMPVADFDGERGWGYDGVLPFAPCRAYGAPETLKRLVDEAHDRRLMVLLDVVYNHFGPSGNYLARYAPGFFTERHSTPWGAAIDFAQPAVRELFIHNALYWLEEYRFDGLRLDAVHAIRDDGERHFLRELAERVDAAIPPDRHVHLVLENDDNAAHLLRERRAPRASGFAAQWNDDWHHAAHVVLTAEDGGYYGDYADDPAGHLLRTLAEGFAFQGEASAHRDGAPRGEPSGALAPTRFVAFLQNHDQVGNRALGERLCHLVAEPARRALAAVLLLAPSVPLLFMGEEWDAAQPFLYFCDFDGELADAVRNGRRREFARFPAFSDPAARAAIPDPNARETFAASCLDWAAIDREAGRAALAFHRALLTLRAREIVPRLGEDVATIEARRLAGRAFRVAWRMADGSRLTLLANLGEEGVAAEAPPGRLLFAAPSPPAADLPPWTAAWWLAEGDAA